MPVCNAIDHHFTEAFPKLGGLSKEQIDLPEVIRAVKKEFLVLFKYSMCHDVNVQLGAASEDQEDVNGNFAQQTDVAWRS